MTRHLGEATDYQELVDLLRAWVHELGTTFEAIDDRAGLTTRHVSKLLAPVPLKGIGRASLGPLLGALGLKLIVAVDEAAFALNERLLDRRKVPHAHGGMLTVRAQNRVFNHNTKWARAMTFQRLMCVPPKRRSEIARQAARARWGRR